MMPGDTEQDALNEANLIGESSFNHFWAGQGLKTIMKITDRDAEYLELITIRTDTGRYLSLGDFLEEIKNLKVLIR